MSDIAPPLKHDLVLASGSPRRRLLLSMAGFEFTIVPPGIEENRRPGEAPDTFVTRVAAEKARAVAADRAPGTRVLGCDTTVVLDDLILGKPVDEDAAAAMLLQISGRAHEVYTGYALVIAGHAGVDGGVKVSRVTMRAVTPEQARAYAATGEPLDKAGGYALQGAGKQFVDRVDGSRSNVIGLPLEDVVKVLRAHGIVPTR